MIYYYTSKRTMARKFILIGLIGLLIALSNATKTFQVEVDKNGNAKNASKASEGFRPALSHSKNVGATCPKRFPVSCSCVSAEPEILFPEKEYTLCVKLDTENFEDQLEFTVEFDSKNNQNDWEHYQRASIYTMKCQKAENQMDDELFDFFFANDWKSYYDNVPATIPNLVEPYCRAIDSTTQSSMTSNYALQLNYPGGKQQYTEKQLKSLQNNFSQFQPSKTFKFDEKKGGSYKIECFGEIPYSADEKSDNVSMSTRSEESGEELEAPWWKKNLIQIILLVVALGLIGALLYWKHGYINHDEEVENYHEEIKNVDEFYNPV